MAEQVNLMETKVHHFKFIKKKISYAGIFNLALNFNFFVRIKC